ncbi:gamma-interferon-inducible lysosomal thiol reductase-like [Carica papaya]|uniref:gamma-interferon-inducible lysosomal thiol reductase-like n=1 Tax=Carica papaya TaxID=3649 RepID=UPI000B8CA117|nr:gamma-interferon-inducible lysosomal thiol reductase-like [Carica papaya]
MDCGRCLFFTCVWLLLVFASSGQKVSVSFYYETLCPYCADFIVNHLVKVFENGLISIVDLRLVPWGNAFFKTDGSIVCQHGPDECLLNTIDACAINMYPDVERHFSFIYCIERLTLMNQLSSWANCFEMAGLSREPIDCYTNGYGRSLEERDFAETSQLNPPHRFVPWLVVNNQPLQEDYENFMSYICNAYKGNGLPEACLGLPLKNEYWVEKSNSINRVCYANNTLAPATNQIP